MSAAAVGRAVPLRRLGSTGLEVHPICLGGNTFGWTTDRDASFAVLDAYVEAGGNFVDTADVYSAWVEGNRGRRVGADARRVAREPGPARRADRRDEGRLGCRGARARAHPRACDPRLRGVAAAARPRDDRPLLRPQRPGDAAARGDARRVRRARPVGQGAPSRRVQLPRAAAAPRARARRRGRARALRGAAAALQPRRPHRLRRRARGAVPAARHRRGRLRGPRGRLPHGQVPSGRGAARRGARGAASRPGTWATSGRSACWRPRTRSQARGACPWRRWPSPGRSPGLR